MAKKKKPSARKSGHSPEYVGSIYPTENENLLPSAFATEVFSLESQLGMPVVLLIQNGNSTRYDHISPWLAEKLFCERGISLEKGKPVGLLIDSYGGQARSAFEIATLLRRYCGGFTAIIPRHAKSAATLLSLGADRILMGEFGEIGPLDMQIKDPDREEVLSVLDEVQAIERLTAFTMSAIDETMFLLMQRTGMKTATLMPHVREIATSMTRPLFENVDVVRLTQMSRILKVVEDYARRLLFPKLGHERADSIARELAERYSEHGFIIYPDEAAEIGLPIEVPDGETAKILSRIIPHLPKMTALGSIKEVQP